ncbi:MAG: MATE family efflux transporter, partial [Chloroflexota bacterium]
MVLSVSAGAMSLVAQAKGARDPEQMSFVTRQAISSGTLLGIFLTIVGLLLTEPLLKLANSGGEPEAVVLGTQYLQIIFLGMIFLVLNIVFNRLMQGAGDTWTPLVLSGSLNLLNILFNYVFMFGFGPIPAYGLAGAAIGTVLARGIGIVLAFAVIYSGRNVIKILPGSYWPNWQMFKDIFSIGIPSGVQGLFRNGSRLLLISIITSTEVGTYGAAAIAIGFQVESLAFMPVLGINVAATSLVGQALGKWQPKEAWARGNMAVGLGVVVMIILIAPIIVFAPAIIQLFDPSAHPIVLSAGVAYIRINSVFLPLSGISMVTNGAMRGAGDSMPGLIGTMVFRAIVTLILAYVLAFPLGFGSMGVWWAMALGVVCNGVYMIWRWRSRAWLRVALHKTAVYRQHLHQLSEAVQQQYLANIRTPLMAQPSTTEEVVAQGVTYHLLDQDVTVRFGANSYQVV